MLMVLLAACGGMPAKEPGFGPPRPVSAGGTSVSLAAADTAAMGKSFGVSTMRVDAALPGRQNWEPSLAVVRRGGDGSAGDDVAVLWMTGLARSDGLTVTGLAAARSGDGFRTHRTEDVANPPALAGVPFDPMVVADRVAGRVFRGAMARIGPEGNRPGLWVDDGARAAIASTDGRVDKGWLAVGPRPGSQPGRVLYVAYNLGVQRSLDGGTTFSAPDPMPSPGAVLPHPSVLPDGRLGMAYFRAATNDARFAGSTDEARTWSSDAQVHVFSRPFVELSDAVPGAFRIAPLPVWAHDARSGALYMVLPDIVATLGSERDVDLVLYRSDDGGRSWSRLPATLAREPFSDQFAPWLEIDAAGRLHLAWFETLAGDGGDRAASAAVHTWYARSDDGGSSWTTQRLTATPVDAASTQWSPLAPAPNLQFVGDYLALDVSDHAAYVAHPATIDGAVAMAVSRVEFAASNVIGDPRGLSGLWFDPATSGQGFLIHRVPGGVLTVSFFGYRNDGSNLWVQGLSAGPLRFGEAVTIPVDVFRGGRFGGFTPSQVQRTPWGTLSLRFDSCTNGEAILDGADGRQVMALTRLAGVDGLGCD